MAKEWWDVKVKCPYCGTEFHARFTIHNTRWFQICPDDEIEGACGQTFGVQAKLVPELVAVFADVTKF